MKPRNSILTIAVLAAGLASAPAWGDHYFRHHGRHHHHPVHHHHSHYYSGTDVFLGATLGFVLGAALTPPVYYAPPPLRVVYREEYVYAPPPRVVYREPATVVYRDPPRNDACLQTREYTTTVTIDGRQVEAWGTRCLKPDGSWSFGPPQTANYD